MSNERETPDDLCEALYGSDNSKCFGEGLREIGGPVLKEPLGVPGWLKSGINIEEGDLPLPINHIIWGDKMLEKKELKKDLNSDMADALAISMYDIPKYLPWWAKLLKRVLWSFWRPYQIEGFYSYSEDKYGNRTCDLLEFFYGLVLAGGIYRRFKSEEEVHNFALLNITWNGGLK